MRGPGADSWKSSIFHPSQNDPSFHILLADNGATSAPLTPHRPGERFPIPTRGKLAPSLLAWPWCLGKKKGGGKAKEQREAGGNQRVGRQHCVSQNKASVLQEELTAVAACPQLGFLAWLLPNFIPGLTGLEDTKNCGSCESLAVSATTVGNADASCWARRNPQRGTSETRTPSSSSLVLLLG